MDRRTFSAALAAGCFAAASEPLFGQAINQEWGNLSATFLYEGEPPMPKVALPVVPLLPGMKLPLMDQSLLVDLATNGIANVVMYLHLPPGDKPAIHPHYRGKQKLVRMDFRNGQLEPRIAMIVVDQVVDINNNDAIDYNVNLDLFANPSLAKLLPSGAAFTLEFKKTESRPMPLTCVAHPAGGFVLIRNNPYMAVTNEAGKLKIENIPVGKHTFVLWHERCGFVTQVKKREEKVDFKLGRITVEIKPGDNDLGVMLCKPDRKK